MDSEFRREIERLEDRIVKTYDRRLDDLGKQLERLETAMNTINKNVNELNNKREANTEWTLRYILGLIGSFIVGSGAIGFLQFISGLLHK